MLHVASRERRGLGAACFLSWPSAGKQGHTGSGPRGTGTGRERGRPTGPKVGKGGREIHFSFSNFSKANLKMQIQNNLKFYFKSHHSKIIMQQHECTHMIVNLYWILFLQNYYFPNFKCPQNYLINQILLF